MSEQAESSLKTLLMARGKEYGETWKLHGLMVDVVLPQYIAFIQKFPAYQFPWTMVLNKLIRALFSPTNLDHWRDIQGYAELVIKDLEAKRGISSK